MADIQLGAHTIKSHGVKLARSHMRDWIILLVLLVVEVILNVIDPFYRFVGKGMMSDLKYPLKGNTVPIWAVPVIGIVLPSAVFIAVYFRRRDVYDLHHAMLGLLYSVLITAVITDAIKDAVGRPRPDFFWRCFPDGKEVYDKITTNVICHGEKSVIKEGHKSFPSGHSSWSSAGLGFLAWYLSGKIQAFDRKGHIAKLCIVFLPLLGAALVAVSRVDDYWHHWQDVFAGGFLGLIVASFCYLQFFPPPSDADEALVCVPNHDQYKQRSPASTLANDDVRDISHSWSNRFPSSLSLCLDWHLQTRALATLVMKLFPMSGDEDQPPARKMSNMQVGALLHISRCWQRHAIAFMDQLIQMLLLPANLRLKLLTSLLNI